MGLFTYSVYQGGGQWHQVVASGRKWSQDVGGALLFLTTPLTLSCGAGVMSSKSDVLKAKLSKLPSSKINAACEALLEAKLPNKGARM